ncbi:hypothetical protein [Flavobacterium alvei]|uniref:hypothetical protein n=1 Tax=Flavobacterium alvei TaxID=2080416 RepID=UPI0026F3145C|nr:hypothetical protein [Flavobacterium alvei]
MNALDTYKKGVKNKYEKEKSKEYSDYLLNPSPAKLKRLCALIFEHTTVHSDLAIFKKFFNFNESEDKIRQIMCFDTDKFRPFQNFLLKNTDISQTESLDLIAVLVGFEPRPYRKFRNTDDFEGINGRKIELTTDKNVESIRVKPKNISDFATVKKWSLKKKLLIGTLSLLILASLGFSLKSICFPTKNGIVWTKDHFVAVDLADLENIDNAQPMNQSLLDDFKKIAVCDTTTFFKNGDKNQPLIWYGKDPSTGEYEYFNQPGLHPVSGRTLKKITPYIIDKYIRTNK